MFGADKLIIEWIVAKCSSIGAFFGLGAMEGAFIWVFIFMYAVSLSKGVKAKK